MNRFGVEHLSKDALGVSAEAGEARDDDANASSAAFEQCSRPAGGGAEFSEGVGSLRAQHVRLRRSECELF